jgi:hypothetical protein
VLLYPEDSVKIISLGAATELLEMGGEYKNIYVKHTTLNM